MMGALAVEGRLLVLLDGEGDALALDHETNERVEDRHREAVHIAPWDSDSRPRSPATGGTMGFAGGSSL
jgi:hypothetical protein